jgi:hypothetical protein
MVKAKLLELQSPVVEPSHSGIHSLNTPCLQYSQIRLSSDEIQDYRTLSNELNQGDE